MLGGDFMFALNDAMGKWLVTSFSVGQVVLIRSVGAFIVLGPMIARQGVRGLFGIERPWLQFWRVVFATADTGLFYAAVVYLPLADVMTFYMAGPIYVAALSHLLLGEKVGWRRWLAILIGFGGVVIALRPSIGIAVAVVVVRAHRQHFVRHDADPQPAAARHQRRGAGDLADAGSPCRRRGAQHHHLAFAHDARLSRHAAAWRRLVLRPPDDHPRAQAGAGCDAGAAALHAAVVGGDFRAGCSSTTCRTRKS